MQKHEPQRFSRCTGNIDGLGELQDESDSSPQNVFLQNAKLRKYRVPQEIRGKWHDLLSSGVNEVTEDNKSMFKKLVRQGIPDEYRCEVWQILAGSKIEGNKKDRYKAYLQQSISNGAC